MCDTAQMMRVYVMLWGRITAHRLRSVSTTSTRFTGRGFQHESSAPVSTQPTHATLA